MKFHFLAVMFLSLLAISYWPIRQAKTGEKADRVTHKLVDAPEDFVVCTGWHALCSSSPDCKINGNKADCDCLRVNENHIVATSEIQDLMVKSLTLAKCTKANPCDVDEAPICKAIKDGQYEVDKVKYKWVSTYSYRGWCSIIENKFIPCDQKAPGYSGDLYWAICDAAPCTENPNPSNPEKPLSCQCRVQNTPFVGLGRCTGDSGGIMSSFPLSAWDFQKNTYPFPMPGYEFVQGACSPLKSDQLESNRK